MNNTFKELRADFPIFTQKINSYPLIACDNASTTHKPQSVIDAVTEYNAQLSSNVHRGVHHLSQVATGHLISLRCGMREKLFMVLKN